MRNGSTDCTARWACKCRTRRRSAGSSCVSIGGYHAVEKYFAQFFTVVPSELGVVLIAESSFFSRQSRIVAPASCATAMGRVARVGPL
jgi:hypothetical protein